nr:Regulator [Kibdelosporangium sp. MJ126-NF4]CTQ91375.1 Regulator [Kibdelosporangium sp. MJ126-NF4]
MLLVDDLSAAHPETLDQLSTILTDPQRLATAVVATCESGYRGSDPETFSVIMNQFLHRCVLTNLNRSELRDLLHREFGRPPSEEVVTGFQRQTSGNPLCVATLARSVLRNANPENLTEQDLCAADVTEIVDDIAARDWRTERSPLRFVNAVAVLEPNASARLVAQFLALDELRTADVLDSLRKAGLMHESESGYALSAPMIRRAVLARMAPSEREQGNLRAASLLRDQYVPAQEVARYLLRIRHTAFPCWACAVVRQAADEALSDGRPDEGLESLLCVGRRCGCASKVEIFRQAGQLMLGSDRKQAIHYLSQALSYATDLPGRSQVRIQLANAHLVDDDVVTAADVLRSGIDEVAGVDPESAQLLDDELYLVETLRWGTRETLPARPVDRGQTSDTVEHRPTSRAGLVNLVLRDNLRHEWHRDTMVTCSQRALIRDPCSTVDALLAPVLLLLYAGEFEAALGECDRIARRQAPETLPHVLSVRATVAFQMGNLREARRAATSALNATGFLAPRSLYAGLATASLVGTHLETGELDAGRECMDRAGLSGEIPVTSAPGLLVQRAFLHTEYGAFDAALEDLEQCAHRWRKYGAYDPIEARWRSAYAMVCVRAGRCHPAAELAADELDRARQAGIAAHIGTALRTVAMCAGGTEREHLLTDAVDILEHTSARLDLAYALFDLGVVLRKANRPKEARHRLRSALSLADRAGATVLADWARSELRIAGARPRRSTETGVDALTPSEYRVALLAAEGITNSRIAGILYVTSRTVEIHLSRVYQKLLISGRTELEAALSDRKSVPPETSAERPPDNSPAAGKQRRKQRR